MPVNRPLIVRHPRCRGANGMAAGPPDEGLLGPVRGARGYASERAQPYLEQLARTLHVAALTPTTPSTPFLMTYT